MTSTQNVGSDTVCGIAAALGVQCPIKVQDVVSMMSRVSHRGPDGYGFLYESNDDPSSNVVIGLHELDQFQDATIESHLVMGHARLSIIDLEHRSDQPICAANGRYGLVFNGEIYNYIELKKELTEIGCMFSTEGDAEVLLQALIFWGAQALPKLRGMFALVFTDFIERKMIVARDRFGIKPLYRWESPEGFLLFASEIKQFTCFGSWKSSLDVHSARTFISNGITDYSARTFFLGVTQVLPGYAHTIDIDTCHEDSIQWYALPVTPKKSLQMDESRFSDLLTDAVHLHLRSDVEIASCLSGGIDSSVVVATVSKELEKFSRADVFRTFTAGSNDRKIDESDTARRTANYLGLLNERVEPSSEDFCNDIEKLIWFQDQPFGSASIFAQFQVYKAVKNSHIKVALDGQGADELFAGYDDYISAYVVDLWRSWRFWKSVKAFKNFRAMDRVDLKTVLYLYCRLIFPEYWFERITRRFSHKESIFSKLISNDSRTEAEVEPLPAFKFCESLVSQLRRHQFKVGLPMLLRFEDRNSMAFGVEARVPFLDHVLVDYVFQISENEFFKNGNTKAPLRSFLTDLVPSEVVTQKKKIGFASEEWVFLQDNCSAVSHEINSQRGYLEKFTSKGFVDKCLLSLSGDKQNKYVWRLYCFALWRRVFGVDFNNE